MAGFIYCLPPAGGTAADRVAACGLSYAIRESISARECSEGPGGTAGLLVADPSTSPILKYDPAGQTWARCWRPAGKPTPWIGYSNADPPKPGDLIKPSTLKGHDVELNDGNEWHVPIARSIETISGVRYMVINLPRVMTIDDEGEWAEGDVVAEFAPLWEIAAKWWDHWTLAAKQALAGDGEIDKPVEVEVVEFNPAHEYAVTVLGYNYKIGRDEVAALGMFRLENNVPVSAYAVLNALIDMPAMRVLESAEKKTVP